VWQRCVCCNIGTANSGSGAPVGGRSESYSGRSACELDLLACYDGMMRRGAQNARVVQRSIAETREVHVQSLTPK
jgi:hypothetical protein